MSTIKAISLWEPWASLIRTGAKTYETRSWPTKYRGPLLICAANKGLTQSNMVKLLRTRDFQDALPFLGEISHLPFRCVLERFYFGKAVALVELQYCVKTEHICDAVKEREQYFGDFSSGRYAWSLKIINNTFEPFSIRGRQGFFNVEVKL